MCKIVATFYGTTGRVWLLCLGLLHLFEFRTNRVPHFKHFGGLWQHFILIVSTTHYHVINIHQSLNQLHNICTISVKKYNIYFVHKIINKKLIIKKNCSQDVVLRRVHRVLSKSQFLRGHFSPVLCTFDAIQTPSLHCFALILARCVQPGVVIDFSVFSAISFAVNKYNYGGLRNICLSYQ